MNSRRLVYLFLAALTILRLIYIGQLELSPDEAYYYQWSQRLDWSYFSKGPGVAVAMWLSTHLFGVSEFGVRVFSPLLALGTSLLMFSFARRLYGESIAAWTVLLINFIPIFSVGSLVMTIDPLSIFFWMAALYTFWLALECSPEPSRWWPVTGVLIGLGFLSKYTNAMELLSIVLLLAVTPKYRRELRRPGFYWMLGTFAVFIAPPIIWNANHDWITIHHLTVRGGLQKATKFDPVEFLDFLGVHFGVYSPLIFAGLLVAIWWGWKRAETQFKARFLLAFTLPLFALYFYLSFKQAGEANWTAPATLSLALLAVALWHERAPERRWIRRAVLAAFALALCIGILATNSDLPRHLGLRYSYDLDPSARLRGWHTAAEKVGALRSEFEAAQGQPVFLIANNYASASSLAFYLADPRVEGPGHPPVYVPESAFPENQYYFWPRYDENEQFAPGAGPKDEYYTEEGGFSRFVGRSALYITDRAEERPPSAIKRGFEKVEMIRCIDFARRGLPLRQLRVFACYNYRQISL
jgi:4-amino-4-deoxy-L-arabinose transferase-like glycosyltransferase